MQLTHGANAMITTDVVVHVTNALDARQRAALLQRLDAQQGITRVRADARTGQLIVVDYDQRAISALGILRCVQAQGHSARLVGM
jgi:hypothetical protein